MGVKRTQDSGKRDALGREIKVSGHQAQRAGESGVSGGEGVARSDFAGSPARSGFDFDTFASGVRDNAEIDARAEHEAAPIHERMRRDGDLLDEIEQQAKRDKTNTWMSQIDSLRGDLDERGVEALTDPQFMGAYYILRHTSDSMYDYGSGRGETTVTDTFRDLGNEIFDVSSTVPGIYYSSIGSRLHIDTAEVDLDDVDMETVEAIIKANRQAYTVIAEMGVDNYFIERMQRSIADNDGIMIETTLPDTVVIAHDDSTYEMHGRYSSNKMDIRTTFDEIKDRDDYLAARYDDSDY